MTLYRMTAYGCFIVAGIAALGAIAMEAPLAALSVLPVVAAGVCFIGLDQVIKLLTDIGNGSKPAADLEALPEQLPAPIAASTARPETKEFTEMRAALAELKGRL